MLAISLSQLHTEGGSTFTVPITILSAINLALAAYVLYGILAKKNLNPHWLEAIKQIGAAMAAYGAWGSVVGFFQMFDAIEAMKETLPLAVFAGGVKVAVLALMYGLLMYFFSLIIYVVLKLIGRTTAPQP